MGFYIDTESNRLSRIDARYRVTLTQGDPDVETFDRVRWRFREYNNTTAPRRESVPDWSYREFPGDLLH